MSIVRLLISVLLIPLCIGFAIAIPGIDFDDVPESVYAGIGIGLSVNILFVRILGAIRLNFLLCFEHEFIHYMLALHPEEMRIKVGEGGVVVGFHTFISLIGPYIIPLFSLIMLFLSEIVDDEYIEYFQFFTGFFYINFIMENLYQIFIIRTEDIFYEGYSAFNSVLVILGNLIMFTIIFSILADSKPSMFIDHGFIESAGVYEEILDFIKDLLLKAGGAE